MARDRTREDSRAYWTPAEEKRVFVVLARWLFRTCRNRALDVRRNERRMDAVSAQRTLEGPEARPELESQDPSLRVEDEELLEQVRLHVSHLPGKQRQAVHLKFSEALELELEAITNPESCV